MSRISDREAAVLGLLYESPMYGYEIEKIIKERGMRNWTEIGFSSIYYVLNRLAKDGLVESEIEEVEGKPSRRVYTVTVEGRVVILGKVKELLSENKKLISPFDLGMSYLTFLSPEEILECLGLYLDGLKKRLTFLEEGLLKVEESGESYNIVALFTRPLAHLRVEKSWVEEFIETVKNNGGC